MDNRIVWGLGAFVGAMVLALLLMGGGGGSGGGGLPDQFEKNYDKVQNGMNILEVFDLLGDTNRFNENPYASDTDMPQHEFVWRKGNKEVHVVFVKDAVYSKSKKGF